MIKIAINGFGRIGRLFFRETFNDPNLEITAINDLGDLENLAYLLKYDTVYRGFAGEVKTEDGNLAVNGKKIKMLQEKDPTALPWGAMGIDVVIESTGAFESYAKAKAHITAGAKKVIITAPAKDADGPDGLTILAGINEAEALKCAVTSNGSCTTNAASPLLAILSESIGIEKAILSTVHAYTATQSIVDSPVKGADFRRGRAGAQNIVPSSTGAAIAVTKAFPEMTGKFDGIALRVPVVTGSMVDMTFIAKKNVTEEEVNNALKAAAADPRWQGIFAVTEEQLVSSDIIGMRYASIADLKFTKVVDGNLVKVLAWYDNEAGYVATLIKRVNAL